MEGKGFEGSMGSSGFLFSLLGLVGLTADGPLGSWVVLG